MLLSEEDIELLEKEGYPKNYFVRFEKSYTLLRNSQGHCVFYNVKKAACNVYPSRPSGCRIYPVIYDEDQCIEVVDNICHAQNTISDREKKMRGQKVVDLLKRIDEEAKQRHSS